MRIMNLKKLKKEILTLKLLKIDSFVLLNSNQISFFYFVNVNNILNPYLSKLLSGIFFYFIKQSAKKMIKILQKES